MQEFAIVLKKCLLPSLWGLTIKKKLKEYFLSRYGRLVVVGSGIVLVKKCQSFPKGFIGND